jgi:hypothetical protein
MGHRSTTVPVIEADSRPIRVKPENAGGMQIAGGNEDIMSGGSDTNGGKLAPPPEAPAPQALLLPPPPASPPPTLAAPTPSPASAAVAPAAPKPAAPVEKRAAAPAPAAAPPAATPSAKAPMVQLAAVGSEDAAHSEWQRLEKHWPDLFGHRQPAFSKTERSGRALWRVRTGGFSDVAQATAFCERVRAKGTGCSIADF